MLHDIPGSAFGTDSADVRLQWLQFVCSVDDAPQTKHPVIFYAAVARVLAECMGSAQPTDYQEPFMRQQIIDLVKAGSKPFESEGEPWKSIVINPAQVALALRVQQKAGTVHGTPAAQPAAQSVAGGGSGAAELAEAMKQYVQMQQASMTLQKKKGTLSFDKMDRAREVGLSGLPEDELPTDESLIKLEDAGKAARDRGRKYIGSSEGEDLQVNFRPAWTRTPQLDVVVGNGTLEEKMKTALNARKARTEQQKVDFLGFANFQGHVLDWGLKMVLTKAATLVDIVAYQLVLIRIAEEYGGSRTAYYYDLLLRQKLAKYLERSGQDVSSFLTKMDNEVLKYAQSKVEAKAKDFGGKSAGSGKGGGKGFGKSHNAARGDAGNFARRPRSPPVRSRSPNRGSGGHNKPKGKGYEKGGDKGSGRSGRR